MFIKSNKHNEEWHRVFLWLPKRSKDGIHWLKFVERRYVNWLDRPLLCRDKKHEYRLLK